MEFEGFAPKPLKFASFANSGRSLFLSLEGFSEIPKKLESDRLPEIIYYFKMPRLSATKAAIATHKDTTKALRVDGCTVAS